MKKRPYIAEFNGRKIELKAVDFNAAKKKAAKKFGVDKDQVFVTPLIPPEWAGGSK